MVIAGDFRNNNGTWQGANANLQVCFYSNYINTGAEPNIPIDEDDVIRVAYDNYVETLTVDGNDLAGKRNWNGWTTNIEIFKLGSYNSITKGKLRYAQVEATYPDGNTYYRNYIPCYRKTDGVIGLYDTIECKFYTNKGGGTFGKGDDLVSKLDGIINENTNVTLKENHVLYARWSKI